MAETDASIQKHYGSGNLIDRILNALQEAGCDTDNLTVEMLSLIDQLHAGGLTSTKAQAELAGVTGEMRVLDAGCGIGGACRYLAHSYGCRVEAIDLTPEYVETAQRLNAMCDLDDRIAVRQGSVTALPYADESFDLVWCQNVTMNVEDKPRMFAEAFRVLLPGGRYTFSHAAQGPAGEPYYPLPWAREPSYSHLGTPEEIVAWVEGAGFRVAQNIREAGTPGSNRPGGTNALGPATAMGADMPERQANAARSGKEDRLVGMIVLAERPA
jgi:SAM-dependent methyltransferase